MISIGLSIWRATLSGGINPASITALKYWLDAGDISASDGDSLVSSHLVDKSASARGQLQATANAVYKASTGNGAFVRMNGATSYFRSPSFTLTQPCRILMVVRGSAWAGAHRLVDGNTTNHVWLQQTGITPKFGMGSGGSSTVAVRGTAFDSEWVLVDGLWSGSSSTLRVNNNLAATGDPGTTGISNGLCFGAAGSLNAGFFYDGDIAEIMVADNSTLSAGDLSALRAYLIAKHGIQSKKLLVCDGNSLIRGYATADTRNADIPTVLHGLLGTNGWRKVNNAADSTTTPQRITTCNANDASYVGADIGYESTYFLGWEGINHIVGGADATTAYNSLVTYYSGRQAAGYTKVIAMTIMDSSAFTAPQKVIAQTVNANLRANWPTFANHLIDVEADSRFNIAVNASANASVFYDGTHLTDEYYAVVAGLIYAGIQ